MSQSREEAIRILHRALTHIAHQTPVACKATSIHPDRTTMRILDALMLLVMATKEEVV